MTSAHKKSSPTSTPRRKKYLDLGAHRLWNKARALRGSLSREADAYPWISRGRGWQKLELYDLHALEGEAPTIPSVDAEAAAVAEGMRRFQDNQNRMEQTSNNLHLNAVPHLIASTARHPRAHGARRWTRVPSASQLPGVREEAASPAQSSSRASCVKCLPTPRTGRPVGGRAM